LAHKPTKPISTFGVVLDHVITSLIVSWLLAGLLEVFLFLAFDKFLRLRSALPMPIFLFSIGLGTFAGTFNSFWNLKSRYLIPRPRACILPSIIAFGVITAGIFYIEIKYTVFRTWRGDFETFLRYSTSLLVFTWITWHNFLKLSAAEPRGFEVQPILPAQPVQPLADDPSPK
jgi:hypothetical protein